MRYLIVILPAVAITIVACGGGSGGNAPFSSSSQQGQQTKGPAQRGGADAAGSGPVSTFPNLKDCNGGQQQLSKDQLKAMQTTLGYKMGPPPQQICASVEGVNGAYTRAYIMARIQGDYSNQPREQKCTYDLYQNSSGWQANSAFSGCIDSPQQQANDQATMTAHDKPVFATIVAGQTAAAGEDPSVWGPLLADIAVSGVSVRQGNQPGHGLEFTIALTNNNQTALNLSVNFSVQLANGGVMFDEFASWEEGECGNSASKINVPAGDSRTFDLCPVIGTNGDTTGVRILTVFVTSPQGVVQGPGVQLNPPQ